jgi:potassium efflux system protein
MDQFLHEVIGWLGYLQRGSVITQLLLVAVPGLVAAQLQRRLLPHSRLRAWLRPLALGTITLGSILLAQSGHPWRFALSLGMLYLGWQGLALLPALLSRWLPVDAVHQLESRLLRPAYLLLVVLTIINQLDSVADLAAIPVGDWFGVPLTLGRLFMACVIIYLVIVGSDAPARGMAWLLQRALVMSDGSRRAVAVILRYLTVGLGLVWVAKHLGLNATAILAIAGGLSVGLGFGIKEVFSNFISGLWLLLEGSVRPGDVLFIDGDPCEVRSLGLRAAVRWRVPQIGGGACRDRRSYRD